MSSPAERYAAARARAAARRTELARFADGLAFELDDFQVQACQALEEGQGVLVAAPTGAGKTVVGEFAVHLALTAGAKAFYTTPIKALSNQKYRDLVAVHGPDRVGLLTGDTSVNGEAPVVVMTTEVLRNMLYTGSQTLADLGFVVMDEVHYLADRFRGPVWEEVILHLPDAVQLVSLSATVSNAEELGDWLTEVRGTTAVVVSERRPVPLWQHVLTPDGLYDLYALDVDPTAPGADPPINPDLLVALRRAARSGTQPWHGHRRGKAGQRDRAEAQRGRGLPRSAVVDVLDRRGLLPAIFFVFSRAGCDAAVAQCLRSGLRLTTPAELAQIRALVNERAAAIPPGDLGVLGFAEWSQSLERGIAAHHAGLLPVFKETVEELFTRGLVKVVFATETLALGINMPARSVALDTLSKWDGSAHVDLTPGEYTQLTGRAGRRGIDVEGHAVVVEHGRLDPVALAGLASRRTYPLRSSFRPTYNMAVNLVAQFGRDRAREVLEQSFAQFQADRAVVGLARQAKAHAEALAGYAEAMTCHLGDFAEYAGLRRSLTEREQDLHREDARRRAASARAGLAGLQRGDVLEIAAGRRPGHAVVLDPGSDGFAGPEPTVVTSDARLRTLRAADLARGVRVVARIAVPKHVAPRNAKARADLAATVRAALADPARRVGPPEAPVRAAAADDATIAELRRRLRAHPCHGCSQREDHARWAERHHRVSQEHAALVRRIEGRTSSIAREFDKVCAVLVRTGHLVPAADGFALTPAGTGLRRLYAEHDLLVAQCLRTGAWAGLDPAQLAGVIAAVVYEARRDDGEENGRAPVGRLADALDATVRVWSQLTDLETEHGLTATGRLDLGLVGPMHRWASGKGLAVVLAGSPLAAGDFVRWAKQVVDLLGQVADVADPRTAQVARQAIERVRRGVVAYTSV